MKRYTFVLVVVLAFVVCGGQADAYSLTLQKDGIYAEALPDSVVNNSTVFFKKYVKKAMKYYKKYKDADDYTLATKVPDEYRDFMQIAKQIRDSDEVIIRHPFFIYEVGGNGTYTYYFVAEKNGNKLCLFGIDIDPYTGKSSFWYDKSMDHYFLYDEKLMDTALFYTIEDITFVQTPEKIGIVRDQTTADLKMEGMEAGENGFQQKDYDEKKEEIFTYLKKIKKGGLIKKSDENMKRELKDEYIEPEKDSEENGSGKGIYIAAGVVVVIAGIAAVLVIRKKRAA